MKETEEEKQFEVVVEAFEEEPYTPEIKSSFSHTIVGVSSRSPNDDLDHVNFYKIIKIDDGIYQLFDFSNDVI